MRCYFGNIYIAGDTESDVYIATDGILIYLLDFAQANYISDLETFYNADQDKITGLLTL